jgi:DNA-binding NarL/FixJ family response regulator
MAEWPNAVVLKTIEPKGSGGSNPSLSAIFIRMKTVAIIEDQTAIREMLIQAFFNNVAYQVVIESGDGLQGCEQCIEQKPDFVILDAMLPNLNGTEVLRRFANEIPETRVLIFSGFQTPGLVREFLQAGAHGFVEKSAPLAELKKGIEIVSNGGSYFGPEVALLLREAMADPKSNESGINILTKREREILQLIAESNSTREIAAKLSISVKTAENHRTNLMRKLDLHDVASLTRCAINNGLIVMGGN